MTPRPKHPPTAEEAATADFARYAHRLEKAVRANVRAPDAVIEDACSFAWLQRLTHEPDRATVYPWLTKIAIRHAWRLMSRETREVPLESLAEDMDVRHAAVDVELAMRARDAIIAVADLPERRRQLVSMILAGYAHDEISQLTNMSCRTINKQLTKARKSLRATAQS